MRCDCLRAGLDLESGLKNGLGCKKSTSLIGRYTFVTPTVGEGENVDYHVEPNDYHLQTIQHQMKGLRIPYKYNEVKLG